MKRVANVLAGIAGGAIIGMVAALIVGGLLYAEVTGHTAAPGIVAWFVFAFAGGFVVTGIIRERREARRDVAWIDQWLADHEAQWTADERIRLHEARRRGGSAEVARVYRSLRPHDPPVLPSEGHQ